ncbi:ABC transporter ATP-binding protein [Streptomyces griseomycini]|uniref:ABC transport system ATP-binding protein n=1 Tax=Streptomyces griseomycini TaxID=66895 RepID=A0A7W7VAH5_9ACTN|nr:ABC transporter ATP-binding protein [Streptomyces griseomycini]MBB4903133.1 putative ABC transport system ATP-binding protein [Streptomyces griseomycini]GGQ35675.1 ABC transporter ATP-binding protein [Streptomyces griseomycini]GGR52541.1 ABC transporter ATP-binding protein [Streptomyces griseomycini]
MTETTDAVRASGLGKHYGTGEARVTALAGVDVRFPRQEFTAIMGPSGSGKSTLMHCVAGLDKADEGKVWIGDTELTGLSDDALTDLRRDRIGFVFQAFNLLPTLTALENILLPFDLAGRKPDQGVLDRIVTTVNLRDRLHHRPSQLSGGQQQRVAVARALVTEPDVVFADEPTGALDSAASAELLRFLRRSVDDLGRTVVMVTHEPSAAAFADRVLFLKDGALVDEVFAPTADSVLERMKSFEKAVS